MQHSASIQRRSRSPPPVPLAIRSSSSSNLNPMPVLDDIPSLRMWSSLASLSSRRQSRSQTESTETRLLLNTQNSADSEDSTALAAAPPSQNSSTSSSSYIRREENDHTQSTGTSDSDSEGESSLEMSKSLVICTENKTSLLRPPSRLLSRRKTLVLDLDETLVHSSFTPVASPDFVLLLPIDGHVYNVYVRKRPHVDLFLDQVSRMFEVVMFTASMSKYADPVVDQLDPMGTRIHARLYRESCSKTGANYVKDLSKLGRSLDKTVIIDNSPHCYQLQPSHGIPIRSWFHDPSDQELLRLLPLLEQLHDFDKHVTEGLMRFGLYYSSATNSNVVASRILDEEGSDDRYKSRQGESQLLYPRDETNSSSTSRLADLITSASRGPGQ